MQLKLSHLAGRLSRHLPKHRMIRRDGLAARFFVPWGCHYVASDLQELEQGQREPELYQWLSDLPKNAVLFDVGTSYGQEAALASSLEDRNVTVVGFDCGLLHAHFCALNKRLNDDRFEFVFAAVGETSGMPVPITCNSDTHLPHLHRKNAPYSYNVPSLALDDYAASRNPALTDIFIEIDHENAGIVELLESHGFSVSWRHDKPQNADILFTR